MANQFEIQAQRYIEACKEKAEFEAIAFTQGLMPVRPTTDSDETLTQEQAAKILGRSKTTVRNYSNKGWLKLHQSSTPKSPKYLKDDVLRLKQRLDE